MNESVSPPGAVLPPSSGRPPGVTKRRKAPPVRRVSAHVVDRRDPRPIIFNYGANLTRHEREKAKERLAMIGVAATAVICVAILAYGWVDQNVIQPAQPVATVNGVEIHKDSYAHMQSWQALQLQSRISQMQQQSASMGTDKKMAPLRQYVQQQLQQLQAQQQTLPTDTLTKMEEAIVVKGSAQSKFGVTASAADLTKEAATIQKQIGGATAYKNVLQSTRLTDDEFRRWVVEPSFLGPKVQAALGAKISPLGPLSVHARHILVKDKKLAQRLLIQLQHGGNWKTLAKTYSIDPGSKAQGGDLGTFTRGQMVAPFDQAAFSMKPGEIRLVQSTFGTHILQVLSAPTHPKLSKSELDAKKSQAFSDWIKAELQAARISPQSAIPNFGLSGLGATGGATLPTGK